MVVQHRQGERFEFHGIRRLARIRSRIRQRGVLTRAHAFRRGCHDNSAKSDTTYTAYEIIPVSFGARGFGPQLVDVFNI